MIHQIKCMPKGNPKGNPKGESAALNPPKKNKRRLRMDDIAAYERFFQMN